MTPSTLIEAAHLHEVLDAMPHKVWMVRPDGPAIFYNRAMRAFGGAALELPDRVSREKALVHPEDLARFTATRAAAVGKQQDWTIEVRLQAPDGGSRWHRLNFSALRKQDQLDAWLVTATDIDDLQRAVLAAQDSATQLSLAAEAAQVGVYSFDLLTREHVWSPELKAIFGLAPDAPAPAEIISLIHPEDRQRFSAVLHASFDPRGDGTFQDEHRIVRTDGRTRWVLAKGRMSFTEEGGERRAKRGVGFVLDITERKTAEAAVAESEERYRTLVESASDIVATLDLDGRITSINPAVVRILGYTPGEMVGRRLSEFVPPEHMPMQKEMLRRKLEGEPSTQYELEMLPRDRRRRRVVLDVKSKLVYGHDGTPLAIHSMARDITTRKEGEARQALLVRELQHRTKNMLAVVQSIATSTLRRSGDLENALEILVGRLHALARAQDFVASGPGEGVPMRQLVEAELAPFAARAVVRGEDIVLGGAFAQKFALLVHELATNAIKHGALSTPRGRVQIGWKVGQSDPRQLHISWVERNGPPAIQPESRGLGTLLMSSIGDAQISYKDEGFEYAVAVPLDEAVRGSTAVDAVLEVV